MNSTHKAEVVDVTLRAHPDADTLSVVDVWGYTCVVKTEHWDGVTRAAYVPPDTVVDTNRPEFAFLAPKAKPDGSYRIRATRLRGVVSQGLLVPTTAPLGEDLYEALGCKRYEPELHGSGRSQRDRFTVGGEEDVAPDLDTGPDKYDVDAWERYKDRFTDGELCFMQEKLDGTNVRAVWWKGRLHVKSRNRWLRRTPDYSHVTVEYLVSQGMGEAAAAVMVAKLQIKQQCGAVNSYWEVIERTPGLVEWLQKNEGTVIYGEIYGTTNRIKYGENRFAAFDVYRDGAFLRPDDFLRAVAGNGFRIAPAYWMPYSDVRVRMSREGPTNVDHAPPKTLKEGIVIRPAENRYDPKIGRVILKAINPDFHAL